MISIYLIRCPISLPIMKKSEITAANRRKRERNHCVAALDSQADSRRGRDQVGLVYKELIAVVQLEEKARPG